MKPCPICNSTATSIWYSGLYDDRYGFPGRYDLLRCSDCGHAYLDALFTPETLGRLYTEYYPRRKLSLDNYVPRLLKGGVFGWLAGERRSAFAWVPAGVRVLDVGCGFGESVGYHQARGCDAYGIDADANARRVAEAYGLNISIGVFDGSGFETEFFDVVTLDQVAEHLVDPISVMRGTARILKRGGMVILSLPNPEGWGSRVFGRYWINWHVPYHLHHYSARSLNLVAKAAGLEMVTLRTVTSSEWLSYQWLHQLTYPGEAEASVFWAGSASLKGVKRWLGRGARLLHIFGFDHLLTRLMDALNWGDNRLVVLRKP